MENLHQCHNCGGMFPDEAMADWTICFGCMQREKEEMEKKQLASGQQGDY